MKKPKSLLGLIGFSAAVAFVAWRGASHSPKDPKTALWYKGLKKPPFHPPNAIFPIAWSALYVLIAFSGWKVWQQQASPERSRALRLWVVQLAANAEWSKLFFGEHRPDAALVDILYLETQIIAYFLAARQVDEDAAACFIPYGTWVAFAALLNFEIVRRNPQSPAPSRLI